MKSKKRIVEDAINIYNTNGISEGGGFMCHALNVSLTGSMSKSNKISKHLPEFFELGREWFLNGKLDISVSIAETPTIDNVTCGTSWWKTEEREYRKEFLNELLNKVS